MKNPTLATPLPGLRLRRAGTAAATALLLAACGSGSSTYSTSINVPNSVAIADVNGDGVQDLVVATTLYQGYVDNPGFANVILNSPGSPGTFQGGVHYATTNLDPASIAAADLTNSGMVDLVVANAFGSVSIYRHGATPGTFMAAVDVPTGGAPNQVVVGDVNGDGLPDLALADLNGSVILLLQDAAHPGEFLAPVVLPTATGVESVALADLNGDGAVDIVACGADGYGNNGAVYVFFQVVTAPPGTFLTPVSFPAGAQPSSVKAADMNGDGLTDLVVANYGPGADGAGSAGVSILMQNPAQAGTFLAPVTYPTPGGSIDVAVGALTTPGVNDVVVANLAGASSISVLLHDPAHPGSLLAATNYAGFGQPLGVALGDLNGDGRLDIAAADATSATVLFQSSTQPGTFAPATQVGQ
ncbi:MAG: VCBS repeat-containing protein [Proteobacteria bacterium]|nr:VCBS repeat-containing protein [Pseudomonadota bacterium]